MLLLIRGGVGKPETIIWGEAAENVRERLLEYLQPNIGWPPVITYWRDRGELRFRAAASEDPDECQAALEHLVHEDYGMIA